MVNDASIVQVGTIDAIDYFHIELDTHDIILAEGAPSESYLDTGNRSMFANGPVGPAIPLDGQAAEACAPSVTSGPVLERIRARLAARLLAAA